MKEKKNNSTAKRRFRPNVLDFLIVIVIIGAAAGIGIRSGVVEKITSTSTAESARIYFLAENVNNDSYDYFVKGDTFYSKNLGCYIGTLERATPMPAEILLPTADGQMAVSYSPAVDPNDPNSESYRVDIRGEFISSGLFSPEGFLVNGTTYIAPGSELTLESKNISVVVTVTDIQPVKE